MNKEDKQGLIILGVLIIIAILIICIIINTIRVNLIRYKYFKGEEIGISKECYVNDKDGCMCLIDDAFRPVDSYYQE